jgi:hypothetical protein
MLSFIFGKGFGGHFTDKEYPFENAKKSLFLSKDDFPLEQIRSRVFFTAHNMGYPFLKYGIIFFIILFLFCFKVFYQAFLCKDHLGMFLGFLLFLSATSYCGFTLQTSLAIGLLFSVVINYYKTNYLIDSIKDSIQKKIRVSHK